MRARRDPVAAFLRRRGCPPDVVEAGLDGLVSSWEAIVNAVADGYDLTLDDYLNDMDVRSLIEGALEEAGGLERHEAAEHVAALDEHLRQLVVPVSHCLWGDDVARREGWTAEQQWWYFSRPREPGPDLAADLHLPGR